MSVSREVEMSCLLDQQVVESWIVTLSMGMGLFVWGALCCVCPLAGHLIKACSLLRPPFLSCPLLSSIFIPITHCLYGEVFVLNVPSLLSSPPLHHTQHPLCLSSLFCLPVCSHLPVWGAEAERSRARRKEEEEEKWKMKDAGGAEGSPPPEEEVTGEGEEEEATKEEEEKEVTLPLWGSL